MGERETVDIIAIYNPQRESISIRTAPRLETVVPTANDARIRTLKYDLRENVTGAFSNSYFELVPIREGVSEDEVMCIASSVGRATIDTDGMKIVSVNVFTKAMEDDVICSPSDAKSSGLIGMDDISL